MCFVASGVPERVPLDVVDPSLSILVEVVLTKPFVKVKVPETLIGVFKVTPALLLIVSEDTLAVVLVVEFLKVPEPEMVCGFEPVTAAAAAKSERFKVDVEVSVPLFTIFPLI